MNGILGRGKYTVAETLIPGRFVERYLHTTAEKIVTLNQRKNWVGTSLAGSL